MQQWHSKEYLGSVEIKTIHRIKATGNIESALKMSNKRHEERHQAYIFTYFYAVIFPV